MPQVPYSGTPNVAPGGVPLSRYHADVSEATFGGNVGAAIHGLGGQLQKTGNELFERGIAMQTLYNHSEATQGVATFMERSAKLQSDYDLLKGKDAVDALPAHNESLKKLHTEIQKGLSNETSQKLFESETLRSIGQSFFHSAKHAGTENQNFALEASDARQGAISNQIFNNPEDDRLFQQGLMLSEKEVLAKAQLKGVAGGDSDSEAIVNQAVAMKKSELWGQRIRGMAKRNSEQAGKWLDEASKRNDIQGEDRTKLADYVQQQQLNVGSRMIAKQTASGDDLFWGSKQVSAPRAREAIASFEGKYWSVGPTVTDKAGTTGNGLGRYQVMTYNLQPWLKEAGMPAMTKDEFLKDHDAQDKLFDFKFGGYQQKYGSFNSAVKAWFGGEGSVNADPDKLNDKYHNATQYLTATNKVLAKSAALEDKYTRAETIAKEQAPDNVLLPEAARTQVLANHNRTVAADKNEIFTTKNTLLQGIVGANGGKLPTTVEELTSKPELADMWENLGRLDPLAQFRYKEMLANNSKDDYGPSDMATREISKMKAFANDHPAEFVAMDMAKWRDQYQIPRKQWGTMLDLQAKKNQDPDVRDLAAEQAMRYLAPTLPPDFNSKANRDDYLLFKGALMDQLQDYYKQNKKPMGIEEIKKVGRELLSQQHSDKFWFSGSTDNLYKLPVPSSVLEQAKKLNPALDDKTIGRLYIQDQYNKLFGGSVTSKPQPKPSPSSGPSGPTSQ